MQRRDKAKREEGQALKWLIVVAAIATIVLVFPFLVHETKLDKDSCPEEVSAREPRSTILIIDTTDKLEGMRASDAMSMANDIARSLRQHERFTIFFVKSDGIKDLVPVFSGCNPGNPSRLEYFTHGRSELRDRFSNTFLSKLKVSIEAEMKTQSGSQFSPIIESLRSVARSEYWGLENRLFIVSDLLEHSKVASLYDPKTSFDAVLKGPNGGILSSLDMKNTSVDVCVVEHPLSEVASATQSNAVKFWKILFDRTDALCVEFSCKVSQDTCGNSRKNERRISHEDA